jgi:hypothetical protein
METSGLLSVRMRPGCSLLDHSLGRCCTPSGDRIKAIGVFCDSESRSLRVNQECLVIEILEVIPDSMVIHIV